MKSSFIIPNTNRLRDKHGEIKSERNTVPTDKLHGRILIPDGIRIICAGLDNDPEKIGIHILEMQAKFRNEGVVE